MSSQETGQARGRIPGTSLSAEAAGWHRVWTVIDKEWAEIKRNRAILWMMGLLPLLLVAMVLGTDYFIVRAEAKGQDTDADEMPVPDHGVYLRRCLVALFRDPMNLSTLGRSG